MGNAIFKGLRHLAWIKESKVLCSSRFGNNTLNIFNGTGALNHKDTTTQIWRHEKTWYVIFLQVFWVFINRIMGGPPSLAFSNLSLAEEKWAEIVESANLFSISPFDRMTRPEGSANKKPTKLDILEMLKEAGVDCSFIGRNDGAAMKKSELEAMANKAGIDIFAKKRAICGKRPAVLSFQDLTAKGKMTTATTLDRTFPGATSDANITASQVGESFDGEIPLNQVTGVSSTYSFFSSCF